jgi:hypothetical protein
VLVVGRWGGLRTGGDGAAGAVPAVEGVEGAGVGGCWRLGLWQHAAAAVAARGETATAARQWQLQLPVLLRGPSVQQAQQHRASRWAASDWSALAPG